MDAQTITIFVAGAFLGAFLGRLFTFGIMSIALVALLLLKY